MPSFIIAGYVWRVLGRGAKKVPANLRAGPKKPFLNRVSLYVVEPGKKSMMLYTGHIKGEWRWVKDEKIAYKHFSLNHTQKLPYQQVSVLIATSHLVVKNTTDIISLYV